MTRTISASMSGILEKLELERPAIVTSEVLAQMLHEEGIHTPVQIVAARLRQKGWLLATPRRGAWEFVPASSAGVFSSNDPLLPVKSFMAKYTTASFGLTFQTAAWIHGIADRIPARLEIAVKDAQATRLLHNEITTSVFSPNLPYIVQKGIPTLAPESLLVHMAAKPGAVRSWQSAWEWLPDLAGLLNSVLLLEEISGRTGAVIARTGYILQGMRPDIADVIYEQNKPGYKTWFGPRAALLRHDNKWLIADTILPFDPRKMDVVI